MNKKEYIQANQEWLAAKAQEEGVRALPKGIYYKFKFRIWNSSRLSILSKCSQSLVILNNLDG